MAVYACGTCEPYRGPLDEYGTVAPKGAVVGTQRIELCLPDPKSGALAITRHPGAPSGAVDCLGFEPRNLLLARELLCQLELAAQGRRALPNR